MNEKELSHNILMDVNGREFKTGKTVRLSELGRQIVKPPEDAINLRGIIRLIDLSDKTIIVETTDLNKNRIIMGRQKGLNWGTRIYKPEWLIVE
jgi:hypothetical protein